MVILDNPLVPLSTDEYKLQVTKTILPNIVLQWNEEEKADNCSSVCCNMFRLHFDKNGQDSSCSLGCQTYAF